MTTPVPQDPEEFFRDTVDGWIQRAKAEGSMELNPSPKCRVCKDPVIMGLVNKMLARGFTIPDILDTLDAHNLKLRKDGKPQITKDAVYNHRHRHFDTQAPAAAIYRRIQEKRALEHGQDWQEGVGTILNHISFLETIVARGYEDLIDENTVVSYKDGADAALKLNQIARQDEGSIDRARMLADMGRIIEVVRRFVPSERWPEVQAMLRGETVVSDAQQIESVRMIDIDDTPDPEDE